MIRVERLDKDTWNKGFAHLAHQAVFRESFDSDLKDLSFGLLGINETHTLVAYCTVAEVGENSCFILYGGAFADFRNSITAFNAFREFDNYLSSRYDSLGFLTENKNKPMIKYGIRQGFTIIGMRFSRDKIFLEHQKHKGAQC